MTAWQHELLSSLIDCDRDRARSALVAALDDGISAERLLSDVIHPAFDRLGELWETGVVALTQQFVAARAVGDAMETIVERLVAPAASRPKVVVGTLLDAHALGAHLVGIFLRVAGMEVVDAGSGLSPDDLSARAAAEDAQVLAVSALMLRSVKRVAEVRRALRKAAPHIKLVVGGAPFRADPDLAARVDADGWASDALQAVAVISALAESASSGPGEVG